MKAIVLARRDRTQEVVDLTYGNKGGVIVYQKESILAVLAETTKLDARI